MEGDAAVSEMPPEAGGLSRHAWLLHASAFQFPMNSSYCPRGLGHTHTQPSGQTDVGQTQGNTGGEAGGESGVGGCILGPGTPGDPCLTPDSGLAVVVILSALLLGCWGILPMPGA